MTNYQRVAVLLLRILGSLWTLFFAFVWGIYLVEMALGIDVQHYPTHTIIGNLGYVALGVLVIFLAKPLVRVMSRGLE